MPSGNINNGDNGTNYGGQHFNNVDNLVESKYTRDDFSKSTLNLLDQFNKQVNETNKKLLKQLYDIERGNVLDIEKTKKQKAKDRHKEELENLRKLLVLQKDANDEEAAKKTARQLKDRQFQLSTAEQVGAKLSQSISKVFSSINTGINNYLDKYSTYMSAWDTRLQGYSSNYNSISKLVSSAVGFNAYVTQSKVFEKLNNLIEQGIAYNVEQRAFLGTVSEKIATTFDALDASLTRLIRIQQADSTAARLGMESTLTRFFNNMFSDTSYLSSLSDSVSAAILDANSQLSRDGSLAFEYIVQKWLGSMSSVGVSDSTIQSIASGINALGTGNVTTLSGNTALQNLLVMAANRAGLDYSQLLTGGMNANTTNKLLEGLVEYIQSIANTNNMVVRSQYAQIFGMTVADLTSLLNLSTEDLVSISENMLTYSNAIAETEKQLSSLSSRTSVAEMVKNVFDNVMTTFGTSISSNISSYTAWLVTDFIEQATGGIALPTVSVLGSFVDLNTTLTGLIKAGIVGGSALRNIGTILSAFSNIGSLSLEDWGGSETTGRGRGLNTTLSDTNTGIGRTTSQTAYIGNSSSSDIYESSITAATNEAKESYTGTEEDDPDSVENVIKNRIAVGVENIYSELIEINSKMSNLDVLLSLGV